MFIGSEQGVAEQYTTLALGQRSCISFTFFPVTVGLLAKYRFFACGTRGGWGVGGGILMFRMS